LATQARPGPAGTAGMAGIAGIALRGHGGQCMHTRGHQGKKALRTH